MDFNELLDVVNGKYIVCDDYEQRDIFMNFFRAHGIHGDNVMEREMHTNKDRWLYPRYDKKGGKIHAMSDASNPADLGYCVILFCEIVPYLGLDGYEDPYDSIGRQSLAEFLA